MTQPSYAKDAFDLIDKLDRLSDTDAVMDSMHRAVAGYGFETLLFTGLPNSEQRFDNVVLGARWPAEWFKIYNQGRYVDADPVIRHLRRSVQPFEWTDVRYDPEPACDASAQAFPDGARARGAQLGCGGKIRLGYRRGTQYRKANS
jgi:LuxR family quorum sensing-dependent transcriptional regulator